MSEGAQLQIGIIWPAAQKGRAEQDRQSPEIPAQWQAKELGRDHSNTGDLADIAPPKQEAWARSRRYS